jgi:hypothetical protein
MKKYSLLSAVSTILLIASCGNTETLRNDREEVETVAPELGPVQEIAAKVDSVADTTRVFTEKSPMEVKSAMVEAVDTTKKTVKQAAVEVKTELKKTAQTIKNEANKVADATKEVATKAAAKVEKTTKEVKESLKK